MRKNGKMKKFTENVAHHIGTNLVHWGRERERQRERLCAIVDKSNYILSRKKNKINLNK